MYHIKRKVEYIIEQQKQAVKSSKMAIYKMIPRWMPFSTPLYIDAIRVVFDRLKDISLSQESEEESKQGPSELPD